MMDKPPPYSPPEGPLPSAPYAYAAPAPPYPSGYTPYPSAGVPNQPTQIGFIVPGNAASSTSYTIPPTTIVVQQPTGQSGTVHFGRHPVMVTCPVCGHYGLTKASTEAGCLAWLLCCLLCLFGLGFGCCLIPFCVSSTQNVKHTCVKCRRRVGYYSPL